MPCAATLFTSPKPSPYWAFSILQENEKALGGARDACQEVAPGGYDIAFFRNGFAWPAGGFREECALVGPVRWAWSAGPAGSGSRSGLLGSISARSPRLSASPVQGSVVSSGCPVASPHRAAPPPPGSCRPSVLSPGYQSYQSSLASFQILVPGPVAGLVMTCPGSGHPGFG